MDTRLARVNAVAAAGLLTVDATPFQVNVLFNKIIDDSVVNERALALGFVVDEETGLETAELAVGYEDYVEIVTNMTRDEKSALRERLLRR